MLSPPLTNEQAETQSVSFTQVTQIGNCYGWLSDTLFFYIFMSPATSKHWDVLFFLEMVSVGTTESRVLIKKPFNGIEIVNIK